MAKRRGNNEGSLFKRQDGRWVAQASVEGRPVSKYFKTQREGREWLKVILAQVDEGLNFDGTHITVQGYLKDWLKTIPTTVRPRTNEQYNTVVSMHILPELGKYKLRELRPDMIQKLYNAKLEAGSSPRTVQIIHAVLHKSLGQALKLGLITRNPADAVTKPRVVRKEMKVLNDTQVRNLLLAAQSTPYYALLYIAVSTGLRQGEILGLKWSDLDWSARRLQVQRQVQRVARKGLMFFEPKSRAGRRVIIVGESVITVLRDHFVAQQIQRQEMGDTWIEYSLIFPSTVGTPMDHRNLYHDYKDLLKIANLPDINFHALRHTAATMMLQQNVHPKVVQERLGHADISLTLNTYSHVLPGMQEEAAEKIDEILTMVNVKDALMKKKTEQVKK
jgi:integrase